MLDREAWIFRENEVTTRALPLASLTRVHERYESLHVHACPVRATNKFRLAFLYQPRAFRASRWNKARKRRNGTPSGIYHP